MVRHIRCFLPRLSRREGHFQSCWHARSGVCLKISRWQNLSSKLRPTQDAERSHSNLRQRSTMRSLGTARITSPCWAHLMQGGLGLVDRWDHLCLAPHATQRGEWGPLIDWRAVQTLALVIPLELAQPKGDRFLQTKCETSNQFTELNKPKQPARLVHRCRPNTVRGPAARRDAALKPVLEWAAALPPGCHSVHNRVVLRQVQRQVEQTMCGMQGGGVALTIHHWWPCSN
jgi:hypothetical protein